MLKSEFICYTVILDQMSSSLLLLLKVHLHFHMFFYNFQFCTFHLSLLTHKIVLLVFKPELFPFMLKKIFSLSLVLELFHSFFVFLKSFLNTLSESFKFQNGFILV